MENPDCSWLQTQQLGCIPFQEKMEIWCGKSAVHKVTDSEKETHCRTEISYGQGVKGFVRGSYSATS